VSLYERVSAAWEEQAMPATPCTFLPLSYAAFAGSPHLHCVPCLLPCLPCILPTTYAVMYAGGRGRVSLEWKYGHLLLSLPLSCIPALLSHCTACSCNSASATSSLCCGITGAMVCCLLPFLLGLLCAGCFVCGCSVIAPMLCVGGMPATLPVGLEKAFSVEKVGGDRTAVVLPGVECHAGPAFTIRWRYGLFGSRYGCWRSHAGCYARLSLSACAYEPVSAWRWRRFRRFRRRACQRAAHAALLDTAGSWSGSFSIGAANIAKPVGSTRSYSFSRAWRRRGN